MSPTEPKGLHAAIVAGPDTWNLRTAVAAETPRLLAAARMITLDEAEAWDVVQITVEIGLRRGSSLRDRRALRGWLLAILHHEASRFRRRFRRLLTIDISEVELPTAGPDIDLLAVREALANLPIRMRTTVVLHHMVGLSVSEVASVMGVSENTVKSQLRVGVLRLREGLSFEED